MCRKLSEHTEMNEINTRTEPLSYVVKLSGQTKKLVYFILTIYNNNNSKIDGQLAFASAQKS